MIYRFVLPIFIVSVLFGLGAITYKEVQDRIKDGIALEHCSAALKSATEQFKSDQRDFSNYSDDLASARDQLNAANEQLKQDVVAFSHDDETIRKLRAQIEDLQRQTQK